MAPATDAPFKSIAIVGLGLIGGSIALKVREQWPSIRIVGVDRQSVLAHALGSGAIERGVASIDEIGAPELIVLAAPVAQNVQLLRELARPERARSLQGALVTDVGGTKRDIVAVAGSISLPFTFIGGHPIGGAERGGFGFARPDLFVGRPWLFTPDESASLESLLLLERFVVGLGARPATVGPADHDRLMAYVSHLPQLTASALMAVVGTGAAAGLRLAGRGLVDTTRLAASPASVWRDISISNSDYIGDALDSLIATLTNLRRNLETGAALEETFHTAERCRMELMKGRD